MRLQGNRFLTSSIFAIILAAFAAAQATTTPLPILDPVSYPWSYSFPPVGLAFPETLQINLVNRPSPLFAAISPIGICTLCTTIGVPVAGSTGAIALATTSPAATTTCTGTITFTNALGKSIGTPVPFTVPSGQIFSAPLPFSMTGYTGFRGEILASVQGTTTLPSTNVCSLTMSLETFDTNTGVTHIFLTAPNSPIPAYLAGNFSAILPVPGSMLNSK
jgi:hypothetical protein